MQTDHSLNAGQAIASENICQAIAKEANMLSCVNKSVVWEAMLSPANTAAVSAGAAAPRWARHSGDKGLQMETVSTMIRDVADEMYEEGVKESNGLVYGAGSKG